ncbi:MAG TPA: DNA ligase D [Rhizomicrobium sp.]|jgi:bifunctional non-homologous end joining protein LigD|nr:DNA ligase D [Rhizomicrobium sp.]
MPPFVEPELARVVDLPASGPLWVHEIKFDGYRMQLRVEKKRAVLLTRKKLDWSHRFPEIVAEARALPDCIVDGEVAALDTRGISNFGDLQSALSDTKTAGLVYFVFDLLFLNGRDFRGLPLTGRKAELEQLLSEKLPHSSRIRYVEHYESSGKEMLEAACRTGLEGVISKRADQTYKSGRGNDWTKAKCRGGQEIVIGGWRGDSGNLRSLLAGAYRDGKFLYMGRIGTGYNVKSAGELLHKLKPLEIARPAFANTSEVPRARDLHWVEPKLVAEVEFGTITSAGILRQASYKGLREDQPAKNVVFEPQPAAESKTGEGTSMPQAKVRRPATKAVVVGRKGIVSGHKGLTVRGVAISNPDKELWPATKDSAAVTKGELVRYYQAAASRILPHIKGRPLSIVRAPDGIGGEQFYQRHVVPGLQAYAKPIRVTGESKPYFSIDTEDGLVALGQVAVLELHPWGARPGKPDVPQRLIFDLDPAPNVGFNSVFEAAKDMRARLQHLGFTPFVKTTGGKGIHVVVAIKGASKKPLTWTEAKEFSRDVCLQMERETPERYTTNMSKKVRGGKIFLDFLRNARTATAVAPWSPRARPGATISMPLPWSKLKPGLDPAQFTIPNAAKRLRGSDPWKDLDSTAVNLETARKRLNAK